MPTLQEFYLEIKKAHGRFFDVEDYILCWGDSIPVNLKSCIQQLGPSQARGFVTDALIARHYALRQQTEMSLVDFSEKLRLSNAICKFIDFLIRFSLGIEPKLKNGETITDDEQAIFNLYLQISSMCDKPDLEAMDALKADGRSIVLLSAHLGFTNEQILGLDDWDVPITNVSNSRIRTANDKSLRVVSPVAEGIQIAYMRLIKSMRSEQRLVLIHPDGGHGQDLDEHMLLGVKVMMGRGAANIAYSGRAATFFLTTGWDGTQFKTKLIPGPVANQTEAREPFEARLTAFYLASVQDVLLGPPENLGRVRAFWPSFSK